MTKVKIKNGFKTIEQPIYGDNLSVGVIGLNISSNLINSETDYSISIQGKIIIFKQRKYCINEN